VLWLVILSVAIKFANRNHDHLRGHAGSHAVVAAPLVFTYAQRTLVAQEGNTLVTFKFNSVNECKDACSTNKQCNSFSWHTVDGACYLKDKMVTASEPKSMLEWVDKFATYYKVPKQAPIVPAAAHESDNSLFDLGEPLIDLGHHIGNHVHALGKHIGNHMSHHFDKLTDAYFQCTVTDMSEVQTWRSHRRSWCCHKYKVGCYYEKCHETEAIMNWSPEQRRTCCAVEGIGCPTSTTTTTATFRPLPFDCMLGPDGSTDGWSPEKRDFCCQYSLRGCPTRTTTIVWTYEPTSTTTTTTARPTIMVPFPACDPLDIHCTTVYPTPLPLVDVTTTSGFDGQGYDCNAGFSKWQTGWSHSKKEWCCQTAQKGCEQSYDCDAGFDNWQVGWSQPKKDWCCQMTGKGCEQAALAAATAAAASGDPNAGAQAAAAANYGAGGAAYQQPAQQPAQYSQ